MKKTWTTLTTLLLTTGLSVNARGMPLLFPRMAAFLAVLCAVVVLCACGLGPPPPSAPTVLLNKTLPHFKRRTVAGNSINTREQSGKVVVVKFFAKYCEPCQYTLPAAEKMHKNNPNVTLIGVALDEYRAQVNEMIAAYGLTFPIVHDKGNILSGRFRVSELPATFVAGPDGTIQWYAGENQDKNDLLRAIEALSK